MHDTAIWKLFKTVLGEGAPKILKHDQIVRIVERSSVKRFRSATLLFSCFCVHLRETVFIATITTTTKNLTGSKTVGFFF